MIEITVAMPILVWLTLMMINCVFTVFNAAKPNGILTIVTVLISAYCFLTSDITAIIYEDKTIFIEQMQTLKYLTLITMIINIYYAYEYAIKNLELWNKKRYKVKNQ